MEKPLINHTNVVATWYLTEKKARMLLESKPSRKIVGLIICDMEEEQTTIIDQSAVITMDLNKWNNVIHPKK